MDNTKEQEMELEISLLIDVLVAECLVRQSPYAHESPIQKERIKRLSRARQLLSPETRRKILVGLQRSHRTRPFLDMTECR